MTPVIPEMFSHESCLKCIFLWASVHMMIVYIEAAMHAGFSVLNFISLIILTCIS